MKKEILNVNGMSCSHCERAISKAVGELSGVKEVSANAEAKTVTVIFDDGMVTLQKIIEIIEEEGYNIVK
ncbi:MAG: Copper chaperone CopZ [Firmicutes bacterium ADurb.Bin193]|nr:MAG: Copper chaperone CopZ [Firmicutes bacterium ADurb.Bin193]